MLYKLPDGREIVLEDVVRVSKVRDMGEDDRSIEMSKLSFTIYIGQEETIEVSEQYHFADWVDKKKKLDLVQHDLVHKWKLAIGEAGDSSV
ncbi:MAG: hypothetical protein K0B87_04435 [Candidatus Syntrophosphaera sp.]|nr:hypothetical protein [Candidatus Syntrophosphaera sp.]